MYFSLFGISYYQVSSLFSIMYERTSCIIEIIYCFLNGITKSQHKYERSTALYEQ